MGAGLLGAGLLGQGDAGPARPLLLPWSASAWDVDAQGRAYNTPTLGSELLTDGALENWGSATNATSWSETVAGTSTVNREGSVVHGGSFAARLDVDASASNVAIAQTITATVGQWIQLSGWLRSSVASGKRGRMFPTNSSLADAPFDLTDAYQQFFATGRATTTAPAVNVIRVAGNGSHSIYADDISAKAITLTSMIASVDGGAAGLDCGVALPGYYPYVQAGVISHLDSDSSPANFILGIKHSTAARLYKCVAGTYTQLVSASAPYVVGTAPRLDVRRLPGNVFQLWYNGAQMGTDQTINDAGIVNNTRYGLFSSININRFARFRLGGMSVPFDF